jgi:hypothetical protein
MTDTIEWLETIGKDAKLRHAPADELAHTLAQTDASAALKEAVMFGESERLSAELGYQHMNTDDSVHTFWNEEHG